jgi:RHS repeat-associated protein
MITGMLCGTFEYRDGRGNVTKEASGTSAAYDGENRLIAYRPQGVVCTTATAGATVYQYDAEGRRVTKSGPAGATVYVYDAAGALTGEYSTTPATESTQYLTADHLGSVRAVSDGGGNVLERRDFYPFGGQITATTTNGRTCATPSSCPQLAGYIADVGLTHKFTGKERDAESGLDSFLARYYSGPEGRFTAPDWAANPDFVPIVNQLTKPEARAVEQVFIEVIGCRINGTGPLFNLINSIRPGSNLYQQALPWATTYLRSRRLIP